jgi:lysophospholipase L1-like esterase
MLRAAGGFNPSNVAITGGTIGGRPVALQALTLVALGDSHLNGAIPVATDTLTDKLGLFPLVSPKDFQWNGAGGFNYAFSSNGAINSTTAPNASTDSSIAVTANSGSPLAQMPGLLRAAYPYLGNITVANCAVGGSSSYTWAGEFAWGYIKAFGLPTDGDTVTLGSVTYTFKNALTAANQVKIGVSAGVTLENLGKAVNLEGTAGVEYGSGTAANPTMFYPLGALDNTTVNGRFYSRTIGAAGNGVTLAGTNTAGICPATSGLVATTSRVTSNGADASALYVNAKSKLSGIGTVDAFLVSLGTNDAERAGFRGTGTQTYLAALIANIKADYPGAKVILHKPFVSGRGPTNTTALDTYINPAVAALAAADPGTVSYVDLYSLGTGGTGNIKILGSDGTHGTSYAYALMAQLDAKAIATALSLV